MNERRAALAIIASILLAAFALPWGGYRMLNHDWHLRLLPKSLGVTRVLYVEEKAWGFGGPGDNETGVIVYELPAEAARRIEADGLSYLSSLEHRYPWSATPLQGDDDWLLHDGLNEARPLGYRPRLADFLDRYGFSIPIEPRVLALADEALNTSGAYYASARGGGLLIVAPRARRVVLAYAG